MGSPPRTPQVQYPPCAKPAKGIGSSNLDSYWYYDPRIDEDSKYVSRLFLTGIMLT